MNLPWNFDSLSSHPCLTIEFIKKYLVKPWNWKKLSKNSLFSSDGTTFLSCNIHIFLYQKKIVNNVLAQQGDNAGKGNHGD